MARRSPPQPAPDCAWHVFYGPNEHARRRALAQLLDDLLPPADREFALDRLDGAGATAGAILRSAQTVPFMAPHRVVLVTGAQHISRSEQQALATSLHKVVPPSVVILEVTARERRRLLLEPTLAKALGQGARLLQFAAPDQAGAQRWAVQQAARLGATLQPAGAALLVQRLGTDLASLEREVEKLSLYEAGQPITRAVVAMLTPRLPEEDIFKLADAIGDQHPAQALLALDDLLRFHNRPPHLVLAMIAGHFRRLWQVKLLVEGGWGPGRPLPPELATRLPQGEGVSRLPSWIYGRLATQAARFSWPRLQQVFLRMLQCDLAIKDIEGTMARPVLALELLIGDLCRAWSGHRPEQQWQSG